MAADREFEERPLTADERQLLEREEAPASSVGEQFPLEQARVRDLLVQYKAIGPAGSFGAVILEGVLQRADQAAISGDVLAILRSFEELKGCE